jgi:hydroxymethylpyrimidine/phosphomethylpyrimidine kinase
MAVSISETLAKYKNTPVIFDPVMVATSGDKLIKEDTVSVLKRVLFPLMTLITPNLDEAEILTGQSITSVQEMQKAAKALLQSNCGAVLLKGGHLKGEKLYDVYINANGDELIFESDYIDSENVHGTGCTLSSAIAAYLALGNDLPLAIEKARIYVHDAILFGKDVKTGQGHGPLNHFFNPQKLELHEMV